MFIERHDTTRHSTLARVVLSYHNDISINIPTLRVVKRHKKLFYPVERYALPNNDKIKYAFYVQPVKKDTLQRGKVQPANGKYGGGKEAYFDNGTAEGTFLKQTEY